MKKYIVVILCFLISAVAQAQVNDSMKIEPSKFPVLDTSLRIINLNPYFSLHVDSSLSYQLLINKDPKKYYWFLKNAPSGMRIDKDNGALAFKSNKSLFLSGRLKYDIDYTVKVGVQNLSNPLDHVDTSFTITFYNTDVIVPRIKPSVVSPITIEEGTKLNFNVMCENGNFPITKILFSSSATISNFKLPKNCDDNFEWTPPYDFVNEKDSARLKIVTLHFIGTSQFNFSDTARVRVIVKDGLNFDYANDEFKKVDSSINRWLLQLKYTFLQLDKRVRKTKNTRSTFDIASATSTVTGTIVATASDAASNKNLGKILPSAGVVILPIKEAASPNKTVEQNQATSVRSTIKRLEYILFDNRLVGDRDPNIVTKTETLKKELRQSQIQLAEVPTEVASDLTEEQLNNYFNSPKVQKKYRLR